MANNKMNIEGKNYSDIPVWRRYTLTIEEAARQRVSATKSGNGLQKTLQTISIWRWLLFILLFYFSVVLVVIREKSPEIRDFPRQPARQRDSNRGCNGLSFSEGKLHLFCDLHKTVHRFFRRIAGFRCRVFTLPALLSAVFGKHSWVRERENPATDSGNPSEKTMDGFVEVTEQMELPF